MQTIEPQARFYYQAAAKPREDRFWKDMTVVGEDLKEEAGQKPGQGIDLMRMRQKGLKQPESFKIDDRKGFLKDFADRKSVKDLIEISESEQESLSLENGNYKEKNKGKKYFKRKR